MIKVWPIVFSILSIYTILAIIVLYLNNMIDDYTSIIEILVVCILIFLVANIIIIYENRSHYNNV